MGATGRLAALRDMNEIHGTLRSAGDDGSEARFGVGTLLRHETVNGLLRALGLTFAVAAKVP